MHPLSKPKIDLTGARVGRLRILSYSQASDSRKAWVCLCDCGATVEIRGVNLRSGKTKSCGCLKAERMAEGIGKRHGMYGTRENKSWSTMIERCTNPKAKSYPDYGGRGITVCERWLSFENFFADMGPRPEGSTLDRKENSLGYRSARRSSWPPAGRSRRCQARHANRCHRPAPPRSIPKPSSSAASRPSPGPSVKHCANSRRLYEQAQTP